MRRAAKRKEHPLSMRLPDSDIAIIDRAAGCEVDRARILCGRLRCERPKTY